MGKDKIMFTCMSCIPSGAKWLFDMAMGISFGPCECCGVRRECVDYHGSFPEEEKQEEKLDAYKYDDRD